MSDNPYEASLEYGADPDFVPPQQTTSARPVAVTVFGVLNLAFGGLGLLGSISSAVLMLSFTGSIEFQAQTVLVLTGLLGFVCSTCALIGGVGLLRWRRYGRTYSIFYAYLSIISSLISTLGSTMVMYGATSQNGPSFTLTAFLAMLLVGVLFRSIYPVLLLIFMYSPNVRLALSQPAKSV